MPPTLKKVEGAYCFGLVHLCMRPFKNKIKLGFLNFINGFLIKKELTCIDF